MQAIWKSWAPYLIGLLGTLLFVDLFLGWHRASVSVAGAVDIEGDSSAWAGWGAVAGVLLVAVLLWEGLRLRGAAVAQSASAAVVSFMLALGVVAFTAIEFFAGTASVQTGSVVTVDVHGRQWPAYAGLALAGLLALAAVAPLVQPAEQRGGRLGLGVR